jgi:DNA-binding MarR family transcriptional regulator
MMYQCRICCLPKKEDEVIESISFGVVCLKCFKVLVIKYGDNPNLNENDYKLLRLCEHREMSVNEIARHLKVNPSSVSVKLKGLEEKGLIVIRRKGQGKKTYVRTREDI